MTATLTAVVAATFTARAAEIDAKHMTAVTADGNPCPADATAYRNETRMLVAEWSAEIRRAQLLWTEITKSLSLATAATKLADLTDLIAYLADAPSHWTYQMPAKNGDGKPFTASPYTIERAVCNPADNMKSGYQASLSLAKAERKG